MGGNWNGGQIGRRYSPMRHTKPRLHVCVERISTHIWHIRASTTISPLQGLNYPVCIALDFEDLNGFVGGTGRESSAIIVQSGIVLWPRALLSILQYILKKSSCHSTVAENRTYNHIIMTGIRDYLRLKKGIVSGQEHGLEIRNVDLTILTVYQPKKKRFTACKGMGIAICCEGRLQKEKV